MALSDEQLRQWDERGAVTVETPLVDDPALLARVREAMLGGMPWTHDNNFNPLPKPGRVTAAFPPLAKNDWLDWGSPSPLLQVAGLPWFEAAARQCLRAERVRYCATGLSASYPEEGPWSCGQHIDLQYRLEQWEATPRRCLVSFFIWLSDANSRRAPLCYRPGSHRTIAARNSAQNIDIAGLEQKHGSLQELLDGGTLLENELAPVEKAEGRAGSVTITTTALVHGGSTNVDTEPRLSCHMTYAAADFVEAGFDGIIEFSFPEHWRRLRAQLPPDRRHIVPVPSDHPRL